MKRSKFQYSGSVKISSWGCHFDSLTELKYAISIQEEYEFLRSRVAIFYNPSDRQPTNYLRGNYLRYTPDFLIRNKTTGEAFLIEIKPRAFEGDPQLDQRKEVAENYIRWKKYDWKYKVVYDDEIILTAEQLESFFECRRLKSRSAFQSWYEQYSRRFDNSNPSLFTNASPNARVSFIMFGYNAEIRRSGFSDH